MAAIEKKNINFLKKKMFLHTQVLKSHRPFNNEVYCR